MEMRTILITTDFSETSRQAFPHAAALADTFGARLVVAFVEEDKLPPLVVEYTAVGLDELMQEQHARAEERLAEFCRESLGDREVRRVVTSGAPHVEIVRLAQEFEADLIVMATHGRGFISHAILGSTTERVLRRAECPVYVVRANSDEEEDAAGS